MAKRVYQAWKGSNVRLFFFLFSLFFFFAVILLILVDNSSLNWSEFIMSGLSLLKFYLGFSIICSDFFTLVLDFDELAFFFFWNFMISALDCN